MNHHIKLGTHGNYVFFSALVWGSSVKHNPQSIGKNHELNDEDVVQVIKK
jgi:ribosome-interacting GTPase 1